MILAVTANENIWHRLRAGNSRALCGYLPATGWKTTEAEEDFTCPACELIEGMLLT